VCKSGIDPLGVFWGTKPFVLFNVNTLSLFADKSPASDPNYWRGPGSRVPYGSMLLLTATGCQIHWNKWTTIYCTLPQKKIWCRTFCDTFINC